MNDEGEDPSSEVTSATVVRKERSVCAANVSCMSARGWKEDRVTTSATRIGFLKVVNPLVLYDTLVMLMLKIHVCVCKHLEKTKLMTIENK